MCTTQADVFDRGCTDRDCTNERREAIGKLKLPAKPSVTCKRWVFHLVATRNGPPQRLHSTEGSPAVLLAVHDEAEAPHIVYVRHLGKETLSAQLLMHSIQILGTPCAIMTATAVS